MEIKRQGDKLRQLELRFIQFTRDYDLRESQAQANETILKNKLTLLETEILKKLDVQ